MRYKSITLAVLAVSLLLVGATGAVAAQPDNDSDAGPPSDLPDPVPDFVEDILGSISDFLSGILGAVGDAISGIATER